MKIKLFEAFAEEEQFPDNFNNKLKRNTNFYSEKYIDDPSKRKVKPGNYDADDYIVFGKNFVNVGVQDPTKSVHMFLTYRTDSLYDGSCKYYVIPEKDAKFSFTKVTFYGGLGTTYFHPEEVYDRILGKNYTGIKWYKDKGKKLFRTDKNKYIEEVNKYQQELFDLGVIGNLTYDELVDLCHQDPGPHWQVWTESRCLHVNREKKENDYDD